MNIILTNFCNGKCPYCFAAEAMYGENAQNQEQEFSLENFDKTLDYLYKSNPHQHIRLLWWEPTRHSQLETILKRILQKGFPGIFIFSNGIIDENRMRILKKYRKHISFVWNINPSDIYPKAINEIIQKSIQELSTPTSYIGFNIYKTDYDASFMYEILRKNPIIKRLRIGIAHPMGSRSIHEQPHAIYFKDYPKVGAIIHDFVMEVTSNPAYAKMLEIRLDCGYTPCLWTKEEMADLAKIETFDYGGCSGDVVDIMSDLRINPCFTRAQDQNPIRDLESFSDMGGVMKYSTDRDALAKKFLPPVSEACVRCDDRWKCSGGCSGERIMLAKLQIAKWEFLLRQKDLPTEKRLRALFSVGTLSVACHDYEWAIPYLKQAVDILKASSDKKKQKEMLDLLSQIRLIVKNDRPA